MAERVSRILQISLRLGSQLLLVGSLAVLGGYAVYFTYNGATGERQFRFEGLYLHGTTHLDQAELEHMIRSTSPQVLLQIDLFQTRQLVESETWIKRARVRRKLPGDLHIYVEERIPIAAAGIDNELYLVDRDGVVLGRYGPPYGSIDQPIVRGLKNEARENARHENRARMQLYLKVLNELTAGDQSYSSKISEIDVSNASRVAVVPVQEPVLVFLGAEKFLDRYRNFEEQRELYQRLKGRYGHIASIDVAYDGKVIFHTPTGEKSLAMTRHRR